MFHRAREATKERAWQKRWSMKFELGLRICECQSDSVLRNVNSSAVCVSLQVCSKSIWDVQFGQLLLFRLVSFCFVGWRVWPIHCALQLFELRSLNSSSFAISKALQLCVVHAVVSMDCENLKTDLNSYGTFLGLRYCRGTGAIRLMYCTTIALVLSLIRIICDLAMGFAIVHRASWTFMVASLIDFLLAVVSSTAAWFAVKERTYGLTIFSVVSFLETALYSVTYFVIIIIESRLPENQ